MGGLNVFLKSNKKVKENVMFPASEAFVDEEGNKVEWELRPLRSKEADNIRAECSNISANGKTVKVDNAKFNRMVAARCTVMPNLNDKDLQDSYGVMGSEALIQELLDNDGEYQAYVKKVLEISGYVKSEEELVAEAKN